MRIEADQLRRILDLAQSMTADTLLDEDQALCDHLEGMLEDDAANAGAGDADRLYPEMNEEEYEAWFIVRTSLKIALEYLAEVWQINEDGWSHNESYRTTYRIIKDFTSNLPVPFVKGETQ